MTNEGQSGISTELLLLFNYVYCDLDTKKHRDSFLRRVVDAVSFVTHGTPRFVRESTMRHLAYDYNMNTKL